MNYLEYPQLSDSAKKDAQKIIDLFKQQFIKIATNALEELYTDVIIHIESDSWGNYRNYILDALCNYKSNDSHNKYDFKKIRKSIFEEHRAELIDDLNKDLIEEVENLKEELDQAYEHKWKY